MIHYTNQWLEAESSEEYNNLWIFHLRSWLTHPPLSLYAQIKLSTEQLCNLTYLKSSLAKFRSWSHGRQEHRRSDTLRGESNVSDKTMGIWCIYLTVSILTTYENQSWLDSSLIQNKHPIQKINYGSVVLKSTAKSYQLNNRVHNNMLNMINMLVAICNFFTCSLYHYTCVHVCVCMHSTCVGSPPHPHPPLRAGGP